MPYPVWYNVRETETLNVRAARNENDEKHVCPLQLDVIERCLTLYSNPGDTVLTPFMGVGSEVFQAVKMGRMAIGVELKPSYYRQAKKNLAAVDTLEPETAATLDFGDDEDEATDE